MASTVEPSNPGTSRATAIPFHPPTIPPPLLSLLSFTPTDPRPIVLQTCGLPCSGKSTLSSLVTAHLPFTHLSVDRTVFSLHKPPYPPDLYPSYLDEARALLWTELHHLLEQGKNVVLDFAFAFEDDRKKWREAVERLGGRVVLAWMVADEEVLWERVQRRKGEPLRGENAADISRELLQSYVEGFEEPVKEGPVVLRMVDD